MPWFPILYHYVGTKAKDEDMKKPEKAESKASGKMPMPDPRFSDEWPTVTEYLCVTAYEGGAPRQTSTLTFFLEDGVFKAALNDRDNRRSLYVAADSVEEALRGLEGMLEASSPPWRAWSAGKGKAGK